jgi:hypothetical protein
LRPFVREAIDRVSPDELLVLIRDGFRCQHCGQAAPGVNVEVDRDEGTLCKDCADGKAACDEVGEVEAS